MNNETLKSIGAIILGFAISAILSIGADFSMDKFGIMSMDNFKETSNGLICMVISYRFIFNVTGCYVSAKFAPKRVRASGT